MLEINRWKKNTKEPKDMKPEAIEDDKEKEKSKETVTIDFAFLQETNPNVVAWIKISGVLEYPVVRGEDNFYYLNHTVQKLTILLAVFFGITGTNGTF